MRIALLLGLMVGCGASTAGEPELVASDPPSSDASTEVASTSAAPEASVTEPAATSTAQPVVSSASTSQAPTLASDLGIQVITPGAGRAATKGNKLTVHYVGRLMDGTEFDSSRKRGTPFTFELGAKQVLEGWERGLVGMHLGGRRRLVIPPALGYGARGAPPNIPPNATLIFEVELLAIE